MKSARGGSEREHDYSLNAGRERILTHNVSQLSYVAGLVMKPEMALSAIIINYPYR